MFSFAEIKQLAALIFGCQYYSDPGYFRRTEKFHLALFTEYLTVDMKHIKHTSTGKIYEKET